MLKKSKRITLALVVFVFIALGVSFMRGVHKYAMQFPITTANKTIVMIAVGICEYKHDYGMDHDYPASLDQIRTDLRGLLDPWGTAYQYRRTPTGFCVASAGPDKKFNTGDDICRCWYDEDATVTNMLTILESEMQRPQH